MKNAEYIGDGVYAFFDGFGIELRTERETGTHTIYLEDTVLSALNKFAERVWRPAQVQAVEESDKQIKGIRCPTHDEPISHLIHFVCGCSQEPEEEQPSNDVPQPGTQDYWAAVTSKDANHD